MTPREDGTCDRCPNREGCIEHQVCVESVLPWGEGEEGMLRYEGPSVHGPWSEEAWAAYEDVKARLRVVRDALHEEVMIPPEDEKLEFKPYDGRLLLWEGAKAESIVGPVPWLPGRWTLEPDRVTWHSSGLPCLLLRHPRGGHLCGYVGVPKGHPLHGRHFRAVKGVGVHGGLTYSNRAAFPICHSPDESSWWLGFDANHAGDDSPFFAAYLSSSLECPGYRDVHFMAAEVEDLAEQLEHGQ